MQKLSLARNQNVHLHSDSLANSRIKELFHHADCALLALLFVCLAPASEISIQWLLRLVVDVAVSSCHINYKTKKPLNGYLAGARHTKSKVSNAQSA